jgi:hypothetical protein
MMNYQQRNISSALAFVFIALLPNSLSGKCPSGSVEVRGKVECRFTPDYKVLVTLIYSEHQLEASGEETALDLHDGAFKGEVTFSTLVSYNPLTGHNCGRRPKAVLVRLIAPNGNEWDRKQLKIGDSFQLNGEQGQYVLRSDLVLHGWCEPKCAETPSTPCRNHK